MRSQKCDSIRRTRSNSKDSLSTHLRRRRRCCYLHRRCYSERRRRRHRWRCCRHDRRRWPSSPPPPWRCALRPLTAASPSVPCRFPLLEHRSPTCRRAHNCECECYSMATQNPSRDDFRNLSVWPLTELERQPRTTRRAVAFCISVTNLPVVADTGCAFPTVTSNFAYYGY